MKKRILTAVLSLVCAAITLLPCALRMQTASAETAPQETSGTPIDVYLIGGQSNAVGCSEIVNNRTDTFGNIWYAGEIERYVKEVKNEDGEIEIQTKVAQDWLQSFKDFKRFVTGGYGYHATSIGPEYGMAKVFNDQYGDSKRALIFKTAYGGTYLHKVAGANWYPRSLWSAGYEPDPTKPFTGKNTQSIFSGS